jgi:hypothetical protein
MNSYSSSTSPSAKTAVLARRVLRTINASGDAFSETSSEPSKYRQFAALVGDAPTSNNLPGSSTFGYGPGMLDLLGGPSSGIGVVYCGPDWLLQISPTSPTVQLGPVDEWLQLCLGAYWGNAGASITPFRVKYVGPSKSLSHAALFDSVPDSTHRAMIEAAALRAFPRATFAESDETDPDEGWTRTVLFVQTGIENIEDRMAQEEKFYADITAHETTTEALKAITVVFE